MNTTSHGEHRGKITVNTNLAVRCVTTVAVFVILLDYSGVSYRSVLEFNRGKGSRWDILLIVTGHPLRCTLFSEVGIG